MDVTTLDSDLLPNSSLEEDPKSEAAEIGSQQQQYTGMDIIPDAVLFSGIRRAPTPTLYPIFITKTQAQNTPSVASMLVGGALNPRRDMVGWETLEPSGWVDRFVIQASRADNPPGTHAQMRRINISEAYNPHRTIVSFKDVGNSGWTSRLSFFAWPTGQPNIVLVSVGRTANPWRCKFELGRHIGTHPSDRGWTEFLESRVPMDGVRVIRRVF